MDIVRCHVDLRVVFFAILPVFVNRVVPWVGYCMVSNEYRIVKYLENRARPENSFTICVGKGLDYLIWTSGSADSAFGDSSQCVTIPCPIKSD